MKCRSHKEHNQTGMQGLGFERMFYFLLLSGFVQVSARSHFIEKLFRGYDALLRPESQTSDATRISVSIHVSDISSISQLDMSYKLGLLLRQSWVDKRLAFTDNVTNQNRDYLSLPGGASRLLWLPDTFVVNERSSARHDITVENKLLRIYRNGSILFSQRLSMELSCNLLLHKYPFDMQSFRLDLESFGRTSDELLYDWVEPWAVTLEDVIELPQHRIKNWILENSISRQRSANHSRLSVSFLLEREVGFFLISRVLPSTLIVIISWTSFWLDVSAAAARVSLGVTTVLAIVTVNTSARELIPHVSYVKSIDVWLSVCMLFVFAALIEYAYVNVALRQRKKTVNRVNARRKKPKEDAQSRTNDARSIIEELSKLAMPDDVDYIDLYARVLFPLLFLLFNSMFWSFLLLIK